MFTKIQLFFNEHIITDKAEKIYSWDLENEGYKDIWSDYRRKKSTKV